MGSTDFERAAAAGPGRARQSSLTELAARSSWRANQHAAKSCAQQLLHHIPRQLQQQQQHGPGSASHISNGDLHLHSRLHAARAGQRAGMGGGEPANRDIAQLFVHAC